MNPIDRTGQRYGRLTAIAKTDRRAGSSIVWLCQCDCGETIEVAGKSLQDRNTRSCGCLRKELGSEHLVVDRIGDRYGRLTVIERAGSRNRQALWKSECDCGLIIEVTAGNLNSGHTRSCGCLAEDWKEVHGEQHPNWKGGEKGHRKLRNSHEYREWRNLVFERDCYTCRLCLEHGDKLNSHHIKSFVKYPADRFELENGMTLCAECHRLVHSKYGQVLDGTENYLEVENE